MHVSFESSHVGRDFSSGALTVRIIREDDALGTSRIDGVSFDVPADFHTHNDNVAAALMTLVGRRFSDVSFNFPISARCADLLRRHYGLAGVEQVAASLEPRRPGRYIGLLLSGGLDSMVVWLILRRLLGTEFKVITADFGGGFSFEERGFSYFQRDVTCRTDLRWNGFGRDGRFIMAVPLLFADYAGLGAVTTGHHYGEPPLSTESLRDGSRPAFLDEDMAVQAGGLEEAHITRSLNTIGLLMLGLLAEPAMLEACWYGSAPPGVAKLYRKGLGFRMLFQQQGRPIPPWLEDIPPPRKPAPLAIQNRVRYTALYMLNRLGPSALEGDIYDLEQYDLAFLNDLSMHFMERYHTTVSQYIPQDLAPGVLSFFHEAGVLPYDERDFEELDRIRVFSEGLGVKG